MARPKLSHPGQPLPIRTILAAYEFLASLKLAVILILLVAVVLAFATFVESYYGTAAVGFLIYHTGWFAALLALLAANIFCAAAIRYPWKRHQTGFVVTHIGLLTLLAGSAITARGSLNSQLLVYLNDTGQIAIDNDQAAITVSNFPGRVEPLTVRFAPGPFNWSELGPYPITRRIKSFVGLDDPSQPWQHPPQVIYENDEARLEVVDFYSRSEFHRTPYLELWLRQPVAGIDGPVELKFRDGFDIFYAEISRFPPAEIMAWRAKNSDNLKSFQECIPGQTVERDGTVVLWVNGEVHSLGVDTLQKMKAENKPYELNDRLSVELVAFTDRADFKQLTAGKGLNAMEDPSDPGLGPAVELLVREKEGEKETKHQIICFAQMPFLPTRSMPADFRADYYHPEMSGRIDILIGPDDTFAYRAWQQKPRRVVAAGDLALNETVDTWSMGGGESVMKMTLKRYIEKGDDDSNFVVLPLPFSKSDDGTRKRVKLRLSWKKPGGTDWESDEFWLKQNLPEPWESTEAAQIHTANVGRDKPVQVSYDVKQSNVGFAFLLYDFDLEVDPGTKIAANYTSHLVQVDVRDEPRIVELREKMDAAPSAEERQRLREEIADASHDLINDYAGKLKGLSPKERQALVDSSDALDTHIVTMNVPLDYPDLNGRQLRFFQENYVKPDERSGTPLASIFRVNYDPGRPVKYLGSGLIVLGIFLMFYMRAYFFKKPAQGVTS